MNCRAFFSWPTTVSCSMQPQKESWPRATHGNCATNRRFRSYTISSRGRRPVHPRIREGDLMPFEKNYARLGLFVLLTLVVVLVTAVFFIQRLKRRASIGMVTYTTDNVFGLDVSSAVRLRGVPVGRVTNIRVDPNGTIVEIDFEVFLDRLNTIGLDVRRLQTLTDIRGVFPKLRAELTGNPLTGEAYLLLDQPRNPPPPMELGFKPNRPYVPAVPSPFTMVQDRLPALLDRADATLQTLVELVARM